MISAFTGSQHQLYKTTVLTVRFMIFSPLFYLIDVGLKGACHFLRSLKKLNLTFWKVCQSSRSLTNRVPLWFIISLWRFSILANYHFQVSSSLKLILFVAMIKCPKALLNGTASDVCLFDPHLWTVHNKFL